MSKKIIFLAFLLMLVTGIVYHLQFEQEPQIVRNISKDPTEEEFDKTYRKIANVVTSDSLKEINNTNILDTARITGYKKIELVEGIRNKVSENISDYQDCKLLVQKVAGNQHVFLENQTKENRRNLIDTTRRALSVCEKCLNKPEINHKVVFEFKAIYYSVFTAFDDKTPEVKNLLRDLLENYINSLNIRIHNRKKLFSKYQYKGDTTPKVIRYFKFQIKNYEKDLQKMKKKLEKF